jgi:hypothetical protein
MMEKATTSDWPARRLKHQQFLGDSIMQRRDFLKTGVHVAGVTVGISTGVALAAESRPSPSPGTCHPGLAGTPAILKSYTAEDHRRRLANIAICTRGIRKFMRKHLVTNYLPGQCAYNLGEYPCRKPWDIGEYDERELDRLKEHGIQLIQVFDEWNDSLRLFGGDKYTALNPAGFRRFIDMAHRRGMKVLTYSSTGFLQWTDPDFRPEWAAKDSRCSLGFWDMAHCSPASPGWRAYLLPRLTRILDEYGADGIYNDAGYVINAVKATLPDSSPMKSLAKDAMSAFEETPQYDGALADLLALFYEEVNRRGGIMKLHVSGAQTPPVGDLKVYDYLWVGEGIDNADGLREEVKNYAPYLVPCIDMTFAKIANEDEQYLHAIPYMQFPLLQAGKPYTGERGMIPGVKYVSDNDFWMKRCREAWKYYHAHPNGPHSYGSWDAVPGRSEIRQKHAQWLKRYMPLVEDGTWAFLEMGDSDFFARPLPKDVVASAFANRELYLVLANYGRTAVEIETTSNYGPSDGSAASPEKRWNLPPRSLKIIRRLA